MLACFDGHTQGRERTVDEHSVGERVHGPNIGSPVCVAKSTRKRKEAFEHLLKLSHKRKGSKGTSKHCDDTYTQLNTVDKANRKVREASSFAQTIGTEKEDEVGRC